MGLDWRPPSKVKRSSALSGSQGYQPIPASRLPSPTSRHSDGGYMGASTDAVLFRDRARVVGEGYFGHRFRSNSRSGKTQSSLGWMAWEQGVTQVIMQGSGLRQPRVTLRSPPASRAGSTAVKVECPSLRSPNSTQASSCRSCSHHCIMPCMARLHASSYRHCARRTDRDCCGHAVMFFTLAHLRCGGFLAFP